MTAPRTLLAAVVDTSRKVGETRARNAKIGHLADCLRGLRADEVRLVVAFLSGEMRQGRIGVGYAAVSELTVAGAATEPVLTVVEVDATFDRVKGISGAGSKAARLSALTELLGRATREEQDFLKRLLIGEVRQGALEGIMADAIARAAEVEPAAVRRAAMLSGDVQEVASVALTEGAVGLSRFALQLFRPLQPMLAQTAEDVGDALGRLEGEAALEWKLDGARVQVHRSGDEVRVFTRKLNDVTAAVPELVETTLALPVREIVLDGEVLALRPDGSPLPFQTTMRRFGRRLDVAAMRAELPLSAFFFDCLHLDGQDLIDSPGTERFVAFADALPVELVVPRVVTGDGSRGEAFLHDALARGHEGIVAKALDAAYEAGRRGAGWLKIKHAHTLDLVVLAAEWGSGRRKGWLSNLHLGARDAASGEFVMLGKTFKGMTDAVLDWQTARLQEIATERDTYTVFVRPELVVEIAFDGVQESPHYPAGMALRFARLKRYRADKTAAEADTVETVRSIFEGSRGAG